MKEMIDANQTKIDGNQEELDVDLKETREEIKSGKAETKSIVRAFHEKMDACVPNMKDDQKETMACHDELEARIKKMEPNPGEKKAVVERQEFSNDEVAVHSQRTCRSETAASQGRLSPIQERCSPSRSINRSLRKNPQ
jgi:hypothetical protein